MFNKNKLLEILNCQFLILEVITKQEVPKK